MLTICIDTVAGIFFRFIFEDSLKSHWSKMLLWCIRWKRCNLLSSSGNTIWPLIRILTLTPINRVIRFASPGIPPGLAQIWLSDLHLLLFIQVQQIKRNIGCRTPVWINMYTRQYPISKMRKTLPGLLYIFGNIQEKDNLAIRLSIRIEVRPPGHVIDSCDRSLGLRYQVQRLSRCAK